MLVSIRNGFTAQAEVDSGMGGKAVLLEYRENITLAKKGDEADLFLSNFHFSGEDVTGWRNDFNATNETKGAPQFSSDEVQAFHAASSFAACLTCPTTSCGRCAIMN